jgi:hypothetical protein
MEVARNLSASPEANEDRTRRAMRARSGTVRRGEAVWFAGVEVIVVS